MGFFDRFRNRGSDREQQPDPEELRARWGPMLRDALDQAEGGAPQSPPADPEIAELRARAGQLQEQITAAERRENTPAAAAGHDVGDDVTIADLREGPNSTELQDDYGLLLLSRPEAFHGTEFDMPAEQWTQMASELLTPDPEMEEGDGPGPAAGEPEHTEPEHTEPEHTEPQRDHDDDELEP